MNIRKWNTHRLLVKKTNKLVYQNSYDAMQTTLNETIHKINNYITEINTRNKMVTPFIQSFVHKSAGDKIRIQNLSMGYTHQMNCFFFG